MDKADEAVEVGLMHPKVAETMEEIRSELNYLRYQRHAVREFLRDQIHDSARWDAFDKRTNMLQKLRAITDYQAEDS